MTTLAPNLKRVKRKAKSATDAAKAASGNPWYARATRLGYVIRALLYALVGTLALRAALGLQGETEDLRGSLILLPDGPIRPIVLVIFIVGLCAYALWGFVRAIFDPLKRGADMPGLAARVGFLWSGLNYLLLVVFAFSFLVGAANNDGSDSLYRLVNGVMAHPGGWLALTIAGAIGTASGLGQFVDAYRAPFRKDLKRNKMGAPERNAVDTLGRIGMASRGVVFTLLGWFVLVAGLTRDPHKSESLRQVFTTLGNLPLGHILLGLVALGLIALAAHSAACALWVRIPAQKRS